MHPFWTRPNWSGNLAVAAALPITKIASELFPEQDRFFYQTGSKVNREQAALVMPGQFR
jgi:hypothetical protein